MVKRVRKDPIEELVKPKLEVIRSELDFFTSPKAQDTILSTQEVSYPPTNALDNTGPVIFNIPAVDDEFTDLSKFSLAITVLVRRSDGTNISEASTDQVPTNTNDSESGEEERDASSSSVPEVSIPNDFIDSLIRRMGVEINSVRTGSDHTHHPQVGVLKHLLTTPRNVAESNLANSIIWSVSDFITFFRSFLNYLYFL